MEESNDHIPKLEEEKQIQEKAEDLLKLRKILEIKLEKSALPEQHIDYLANMIYEDQPRNVQDALFMFKDFMENNSEVTPEQCEKISQEIFDEIKKILKDQSTSWVAKQLDQPIVIEKVQLITNEEEEAGYKDTAFTFEMIKYQNNIIDFNDLKKDKRLEKEKLKKRLEMQRRQEEIKQLSFRLPPVKLIHEKEGNYSLDIKLENFQLEVSGKVLIENGQLILSGGRKYGLIGQNGIGKTTLMYALARKEIEGMNKKPQILMIEQEIVGSEKSPLQLVMETDGEREELLQKEKELLESGNEEKLAEVYQRLDDIEANKAEGRAKQLLSGLGFSEQMIENPSQLLSGGWRMRVALAKVLFCKPDILLLDEPTNHLDLDAVMWLQDYIRNFENTVMVVSHAREFLNEVCTDIINFENLKLETFRGDFEQFEKQKDEKRVRQQKEFESQQKKISQVKNFIDKFRFNAKRASLVQSRIKYLNRIEKIEEFVSNDPNYVFKFGQPEALRSPVIRIDEGTFQYNEQTPVILKNLNFAVDMSSKVALLGANGVGKTTLLKLLTEQLRLSEGNQFKDPRARIAMFSQHHVEKLDLQLSPLEQYFNLYPNISSNVIRNHLGSFGIGGNLAVRPMYLMSGGQKSRVSLSLSAWDNPHILIMDEPTNHLDMESVDSLIMALNQYTGGVIIVSHDQYFVSCVCEDIWYIREKKLKKFKGNFEDYRNALIKNKLQLM